MALVNLQKHRYFNKLINEQTPVYKKKLLPEIHSLGWLDLDSAVHDECTGRREGDDVVDAPTWNVDDLEHVAGGGAEGGRVAHDEELLLLGRPEEAPGARELVGVRYGVGVWGGGGEGVYAGDDVGEAGGVGLGFEAAALVGDEAEEVGLGRRRARREERAEEADGVGRGCEAAPAARNRREDSRGRVGLGEKWRHWRGFGLGGGEFGLRRRQRGAGASSRSLKCWYLGWVMSLRAHLLN